MNKDWTLNKKEFLKNQDKSIDPISSYFQKHVGELIDQKAISVSHKNNIYINSCKVENKPLKLLFTVGLCNIANSELYFCLPVEWENRRISSSQKIEETLPIDIIQEIIAKLERKNSKYILEEGLFIDKTKAPWNKLSWDERVKGFILIDHEWSKEENTPTEDKEKTETIILYALYPVLNTEKKPNKKQISSIIEDNRKTSWEQLCLPLNSNIETQNLLNDAISTYDLDKVKKAVERGACVNRNFIEEHPMFGFYADHTILYKSFDSKNEKLIMYLIENGATVPVNALASIGGWGTKSIFKFLMDRGADINAESVNMTALERAKAFDNTQGIKDLLELGATK